MLREQQEAVYAVTNTDEGGVFINGSTADTVQIPAYVANLFPKLSDLDIQTATNIYKGLGRPIEQVTMINGECKLPFCPAFD